MPKLGSQSVNQRRAKSAFRRARRARFRNGYTLPDRETIAMNIDEWPAVKWLESAGVTIGRLIENNARLFPVEKTDH